MVRRISQIAFASRDFDASLADFAGRLGIGPWFVLPVLRWSGASYRGQPCAVELRCAFANCQGMEYEMIEQLNDTPSIWSNHLDGRPERELFHHNGLRTQNYDADAQALRDEGHECVLTGQTGLGRFSYHTHPGSPGTYLELLEATPGRCGMFGHVLLHGRDWDGTEPVRPMPVFG